MGFVKELGQLANPGGGPCLCKRQNIQERRQREWKEHQPPSRNIASIPMPILAGADCSTLLDLAVKHHTIAKMAICLSERAFARSMDGLAVGPGMAS